MIIVALGSNRVGPWGTPRQTVEKAISEFGRYPFRLLAASRLLETAPFGNLNQPPFINAVAVIETHLPPLALLVKLQELERRAGRRRTTRWGPRPLDLDIIDYRSMRRSTAGGLRQSLNLPHPGIAARVFVLKPIAEIAPGWHHPVSRRSAASLLKRLQGTSAGAEL